MSRFAFLNSLAGQSAESVHGETVQYYYFGEHNPYEYTALVTRVNEMILTNLGYQVGSEAMPSLIVDVAHNADKTKGLHPTRINTDFDKIEAAIEIGGEVSMRQVLKVLSTNGGRVRLLVA